MVRVVALSVSERNHVYRPEVRIWCLKNPWILAINKLQVFAGFHAGLLYWSNWNLQCWFLLEGGNPENPEKNLWSEERTKTNSTQIWQWAGIEQ